MAQRRPNLLLAAVHFLLLGGTQHPLGAHYDTVRAMRRGGFEPAGSPGGFEPAGSPGGVEPAESDRGSEPAETMVPAHDVVTDFKDFCLEHRSRLLELVAVRHTQTNEVGRCTALLPALAHIAAGYPGGDALQLLDLGTSAGLNLLFDSYSYTYSQRADGALLDAGHPGARVHLECAVRGDLDGLPRLGLPPIASRVGVDALPIDPTSNDGALWLLACMWPDNPGRFERLRGALATARTTPDKPTVHRGDIVDDLPAVVAGMAADGPLVVFHSWVAAYLSTERQTELVETVRGLSRTGPVHYVYAESPVETPGLPTPPSPSPGPTSQLATALVYLGADGSPPVRLADMHHHGRWLRWWVTPTDPRARRGGPGPVRPPG